MFSFKVNCKVYGLSHFRVQGSRGLCLGLRALGLGLWARFVVENMDRALNPLHLHGIPQGRE